MTETVNLAYYINQFFLFLPKLVMALIVFGLGFLLARFVKQLVVKLLTKINFVNWVKNTPLEDYFSNTKVLNKADNILGNIAYWLMLLFSLYLSALVLGFGSLASILEQVFGYIPNLLTALVVFIIGVVLAGLVESVVKNMTRSFDPSSAILMGKMASYVVIALTLLIVLSELGIAREFIIIMFVGLVSAFALAFGLAVGLGGQYVVKDILASWYQKREYLETKEPVVEVSISEEEIQKKLNANDKKTQTRSRKSAKSKPRTKKS